MKGSQESLTTAVVKDAANWSTPRAQEDQSSVEAFNKRADAILARRKPTGGRQKPGLTQEVQMYGQAAPASSSSLGSRQGLWLTPRANEPDSDPNFAARNADRGAHCHGTLSSQAKETWWTPQVQDSKHSGTNPSSNGDRMLLVNQVNWATPQAHDAQGPKTLEQIAVMRAKGHGVKNLNEMVSWGTPSVTVTGGPTGLGGGSGNKKKMNALGEEGRAMCTGKLNPRWVETLMGLPIGWTMPSCTSPQTIAPMSCDSSAMESCLPPQSELSEFSLAS
jgi:hypothetical protein